MDLMTNAKTRMLLNHPFFALLLLKQRTVADDKIKTACVDGVNLRYNPIWFETLDNQEQVFLLAHEVMHLALLHHLRRNGKDIKKWNIACDYAINQILVEAGLKMPKGGLLNYKYKGMTAEEIYNMIPQGQSQGQTDPDDQKGGSGEGNSEQWEPGDGFDGGFGDVKDFPDPENAPQEAIETQNSLVEVSQALQGMAKLPEAIERLIKEILYPKVTWYDQLERLRSERSRDDYSYRKGNRNYLSRGIIVPSLENQTYGTCVIAIDTSGSIRQEMLDKMLAESQGVSDIINNTIHLIYVDDKVRGVDVFDAGDDLTSKDIKLLGGGGTDFIPPFEYVEENDLRPKLLLYFTDGYCHSFPEEPDYDVVWLCTTQNFNPPFGEIIYF